MSDLATLKTELEEIKKSKAQAVKNEDYATAATLKEKEQAKEKEIEAAEKKAEETTFKTTKKEALDALNKATTKEEYVLALWDALEKVDAGKKSSSTGTKTKISKKAEAIKDKVYTAIYKLQQNTAKNEIKLGKIAEALGIAPVKGTALYEDLKSALKDYTTLDILQSSGKTVSTYYFLPDTYKA
jgi:hypothetical protein